MQVPEKLSLIGGSILLASTLIFTLKSQASAIIPHISHSISNVYDHIGDAQYDSEFGNGYKQAQSKGWTTGTWGTAKYYIDDHNGMHVGNGDIPGPLYSHIGSSTANQLQSIDFTSDVHAPNNSNALLANLPNVTHINGLNNVNIKDVRDMTWMFTGDSSLQSLDLGSWDTSKDTVYGNTFFGDSDLHYLNITSFHDAWYMGDEFNNAGITQVTVGKDTNLWGGQDLQYRGKWKAPNGFIGDYPGGGDNAGTWTLQ